MKSCVLITPSPNRDAANQLAELMGWGPGSYSVPLSADGTDPATHYGLHAWVQPSFEAMLVGAAEGTMPEALAQAGYPEAVFLALMGSLIASTRDSMEGHWQDVVTANGLQAVVPSDD